MIAKCIACSQSLLSFVFISAVLCGTPATSLHAALTDVTQPGDSLLATSNNSPGGEGVEHAIDNVGQKYLNFDRLNTGFAVQPSIGLTIVAGLRLYTANDATERDPASYILSGGDTLAGPWTQISSGDLALPDGRNSGGLTPIGSLLNFQEVNFANAIAYGAYQLIFPTVKGPGGNSMQIGEVEFLGVTSSVPESGPSLALTGATLAGIMALGIARRSRANPAE